MSFLEKKPLVEEIIKWSPAQVIKFLELNKDKLFLNEKHIKIIENEEISGPAFLLLTKEDLRIYGLTGGPSTIILELVKTFKSSSSFQELEEKHELFQKSEKGKKRVIVQEEQAEQTEQTEHDLPTKILKISNVTETDEMDIGDENNNVNVLITNEDIGHYRESAYNYLIEGNINYLADLIKMFFQSRSMMSLNSMNEAVFQVVVEMLLPLPCRVPELRLVNGEKDKSNGRFGFADIFILGSKHEKGNPTLNIVLELKYIRLTGLKYGKHGSLIKPLRAEELDKLDKKLENEDENVVLNRKYMPEHSSKITTVGTIMENGIRQLQNYINIITKGPAIKFEDSGVLDSRVSAIRDSGHIIGYVIMFIGTRRILIRSYGPITTNFCWSQ